MHSIEIAQETRTLNLKLDPSGKRLVGKTPQDKALLTKVTGKLFLHATESDYGSLLVLAGDENVTISLDQADLDKFY